MMLLLGQILVRRHPVQRAMTRLIIEIRPTKTGHCCHSLLVTMVTSYVSCTTGNPVIFGWWMLHS